MWHATVKSYILCFSEDVRMYRWHVKEGKHAQVRQGLLHVERCHHLCVSQPYQSTLHDSSLHNALLHASPSLEKTAADMSCEHLQHTTPLHHSPSPPHRSTQQHSMQTDHSTDPTCPHPRGHRVTQTGLGATQTGLGRTLRSMMRW